MRRHELHGHRVVDGSPSSVPQVHGLRLGGLDFAVRCVTARIVAGSNPAYSSFSHPGSFMAADVRVDLSFDDPPDVGGLRRLFVGGPLYSVYADGSDRVVVYQPPVAVRPFWVARFSLEVDDVTMWCDPAFLVTDETPTLVASAGGAAPEGECAADAAALTVAVAPTAAAPTVETPLQYPLDQLLVMYAMARREGLLVHAAGVVVEGRTLVCCGRSGAGKSTLTRQFLAIGADDVLSDDRIIVRRAGGGLRAYGTPWPGDARIAAAGSAPAGALLFLRHGLENRVTELSPGEALHRLLPVGSIPWYDEEVLPDVLSFCETLLEATPAFELEFLPEPAAAEAVRHYFAAGAIR